MRENKGKLFKLFINAYGVGIGNRAFNVFFNLPQNAAFSDTTLARKHLYDVLIDERSYALRIILAVNKLYHTMRFY